MKSTNHYPPAQKVSKEEIVAAINEITEKRGVPVVKISDISDLESIDAGDQAIGNHLDELREMGRVNLFEYGPKGVWWASGEENSSEIEVGVIDWDSIDANEIPHEVLAELPEFQDQTYWQESRDTWGTVSGGSLFLMFAAFIIELIRQNTSIQLFSGAQEVLAVTIVGALVVGMLGLVLVFMMKLMQILEEQGILGRFRKKYYTVRNRIIREMQKRLPEID